MPASGKVLEDSIRFSRIRKIKFMLYAVQAVMLVAIAFLTIFVFGGATVEPYVYIPLDAFVAVLVLLLLIICLESFFFKMLEIRFARSSSARHLMAKRSMKRSIIMAVVAGVAAVVLAVPSIIGSVEDSRSESMYVNPGSYPPYFYSSDVFAFMETVGIFITTPEQIRVYVIVDDIFREYYDGPESVGTLYSYRLNVDDYLAADNELSINVPRTEKLTRFYIVIDDFEGHGAGVGITLNKEASKTFTGTASLMLIAFVVTNVAWIAYMIPIERKYSAGSIYK